MTDLFERLNKLSPKRLALLAMDLQAKLDAAEQARAEPIAIVGMACRFPGAPDPDAYWQVLRDGVDAITEIPRARWDVDAYYDPDPDAPGKIATRWGGFVDDVDRFEPQIFGIAPREALSLDPQQRLLLEVSWEALERAGIAPDALTGSPTGVFVGICNGDYAHMLMEGDGVDFDMYLATGNAYSVASGRLSYVLGLQGPALSVDTACSSSLLAVHLAVQSLRDGACTMALAGGTNAILSPKTTMALSRARMMAPDGRCRPFDADAAGFVRSEGCGIVVLKRLSDAVAGGDDVLAVIRGSAINQDGRSNGLTAPNGPSQVAVIRAALADAGVEPGAVSYVETHGTGTSLGDPIEARALGAALGAGRAADERLVIGSAKANVGHLESAAGIAGLIKVVLAMRHREIPPLLHLDRPSPHIPWDELPIDLPTTRTPWEPGDGTLVAGVSSFGFSGTNVHVVMESAPRREPPAPAPDAAPARPLDVLKLSARTATALQVMAGELAEHLTARPDETLADVAHTLGVGRSTFPHRLGLVAGDTQQAAAALAAFAAGETADGLVSGVAPGSRRPDVVFLFTGHGAQYPDMGRQLYATQPVFREAIDRCAALLQPLMDAPLLDVLYDDRDGGSPLLDDMASSQPALFAVEHALATLWRSWGVEPAAVAGHSAGEYVAAVVAGVMSLEDGLKLIAARGRLMSSLAADGEMAAVFAPEERVRAAIAPHDGRVSIAAVNGPESVAISGSRDAVRDVVATLRAGGVEVRPLAIPIAAHSPQVDPILDEFEAVAATVTFRAPRLDVISGMHGRLAEGDDLLTARYWRDHLRRPVRFADALWAAYDGGRRVFLEVGPHPTLIGIARHVLPEQECAWLPSLRSGHDDWDQVLRSVAGLVAAGGDIDWQRFDEPYARRRVDLPTYPFERERYWAVEPASRRAARPAAGGHPLLGRRLHSPAISEVVFETDLGATWPAFLDHHRIYGVALLPSPAYVEMALAAATDVLGPGPWAIEDLSIQEALILPDDGERPVQLVLHADGPGARVDVFSCDRPGDEWALHATGRLAPAPGPTVAVAPAVAPIQERCTTRIDGERYYADLFALGLEFGAGFRGLTDVWRRDGEALGRVVLPDTLATEASSYTIHPALLDACFHLLGAPLPAHGDDVAYLLVAIDRFVLHAPPGRRLWNHTVLRPGYDEGGETFVGDITLFDDDGTLVAEVHGLHLKLAGRAALMRATRRGVDDWLYDVAWQPRELVASDAATRAPAGSAPAPTAVLDDRAIALGDEHDLAGSRRFFADLDALAVSAVVEALRQLGWAPEPGDQVTAAALADSLGVVPTHHRLVHRLLDVLAGEGILDGAGGSFRVARPLPTPVDVAAAAAALRSRSTIGDAELTLTARCAAQLADVLLGRVDPLPLLFPAGSQETVERIYRDAPLARVTNALVHDAVAAAAAERATDAPLRVLEIGGGTGATTAAALAALPERAEYCFTDVSALFVARAEERFAGRAHARAAVLDIERDPAAQGFAGQTFEIVLAANVLHATADLRRVLDHVRSLLAPGGLLVLVEGTRPAPWVDITFGLTGGWWRFTDTDVRPDHPLLERRRWVDVLTAAGFEQVATVPAVDAPDLDGQAIVLARAAGGSEAGRGRRSWLILADSGGVGAHLADHLERAGDHVDLVTSATVVDAAGHADTAALQARIDGLPPGSRGLVHLATLDVPAVDRSDAATVGRAPAASLSDALAMTQAAIASSAPTTLWFVTRGAQPAGDVVPRPVQAPLWGLGRVVALEHPERWGGLVDLDPDGTPEHDAQLLLAELEHGDGEDQVAHRADGRRVARLVRAAPPVPGPAFTWRPDASYLITGGLGGLGLKIARWMAEGGARHLTLLGRRGLPPTDEWDRSTAGAAADDGRQAAQVAAIRAIEALGVTVHVVAADVADRAAMQTVVARFGADLPPLRGVVHAAAALSNWSLAEMPHEALHAMLAPKVTGTWVLHELTADLDLDAFVLFSSTTALWGSRDLGHYAAANQFLDAFAHHRRSTGRPTLSINWGTWDEMRVASAEEQRAVAGFGLAPMPSDQALRAMGELLATDTAQKVVAAVEWDALKAVYEARRPRPFLSLVSSRRAPTRAQPRAADRPELLERLRDVTDDDRYDVVVRYLLDEVARTLGITTVDDIDTGQGLFEMGMDSLMSVELKSRLGIAVGAQLPSTLTFNYPTVEALAGYLTTEVLAAPATAPTEPVADVVEVVVAPAASALDDDLTEDDLAAMLAARLARP